MAEPELEPDRTTPEDTAPLRDDGEGAGSPAGEPMARRAARAGRGREWQSLLRRALAIVVVLGAAAAIAVAFLPEPVPVDLARADIAPLEVTVDEDGRTRVKDRYVISAPVLANLQRIGLEPGDEVQEGAVVARLSPLPSSLLDPRSRAQAEARVGAAAAARKRANATIERVRTSLAFAERDAERQRELAERGATSRRALEAAELEAQSLREELESARFGAKVADHELRMARVAAGLSGKPGDDVERIEVTAPVKGRVLKVLHESAGVVQPATPLLEIGDPAALEVVVDVLTSDAVRITPGTAARIERWGGDRPLTAHVRSIEPSAFTRVSALGVEEQRVNVILDLDEPRERWASLGDGYRVEARIVLWRGEEVLGVPTSAVFRRDEGHAVFRVRDSVAQLVPVEVGKRNPYRTQISEGLAEGETVVVHPSDRVEDGVRVERR